MLLIFKYIFAVVQQLTNYQGKMYITAIHYIIKTNNSKKDNL